MFREAPASSLTILHVAYPFAPVGPDCVGGAERAVTLLDAELTRAGHRSLVVAREGSRVQGTLLPTPRWPTPKDDEEYARAHRRHRIAIEDALGRFRVDVVHLHDLHFADYLPPPGPPVLATLHLPPDWYPAEALFPARPRTFLSCVSETQRRACPDGVKPAAVIDNGVDLDALRPRLPKRPFAMALGRICPEKGFHLAIEAAVRAGSPLLIGGQVFGFEGHERYFREEVQPRLDGQRRFLGPLDREDKRRLLPAARCLLVPSLVAETSSMVAMEALACGTPVIAFRAGALTEIVEHGRTGFLVSSVEEMAEAIRDVERIDPRECRRAAEERFSSARMAEGYVRLYHCLRETREEHLAARGDPRPLQPGELADGVVRAL